MEGVTSSLNSVGQSTPPRPHVLIVMGGAEILPNHEFPLGVNRSGGQVYSYRRPEGVLSWVPLPSWLLACQDTVRIPVLLLLMTEGPSRD